MLEKFLKYIARIISDRYIDKDHLLYQLAYYKEKNIINSELYSMLIGVFKVQDTKVKDIMIPRSNMTIIQKNLSLEEILPKIVESAHSRFPVILENKDEVVGILLAKDFLRYISKESKNFNIEDILRPAVIIPESKKLNILLSEFKSGRNHLAIVVDEYGGVSGLITIEDVLEQIVGDIIDEYDSAANSNIKRLKNGSYICNGDTSLEEFDEFFNSTHSNGKYDTVGGLIIDKLSKLPINDDFCVVDNFKFTVKKSDRRKIHLVQIDNTNKK
tara:strand:- start:312 stop:1127 length:816 start_codon:yes stop_codon:yes gene_type:complete